MQDLSLDDFTGWVSEKCEVAAGEVRVPMTLVKAEPLEGGMRAAGAFRLEFAGPASPRLGQGIMAVQRPTFAGEIFLVPISGNADETRYEAVFY